MNNVREAICYGLIGGRTYPSQVEGVLSGEMQARYWHTRTIKDPDLLTHPDYMFGTISRTTNSIRGAFTLRLLGPNGMSVDELEEHKTSTDEVPDLEFLGEDPVTYKLLGIDGGINFLKITKLIRVKAGIVSVSDRATDMLEAHPAQAYTVLPEELHNSSGQDIGGEYSFMATTQSGPEIAAAVYQQYSPHYDNLRSLD